MEKESIDRKEYISCIINNYVNALKHLSLQEIKEFVNDWFGENIKGTKEQLINCWLDDKERHLLDYSDEALKELVSQKELEK